MVPGTQENPERGDRLEPLYYFGELARAYVPPQVYGERFSPAEGLRQGTIFPELVRPYPYSGR
ncbi:MAG TPA: spore coat associated protein CotJA [Firmicutes bacterium]|nr:spore coat associated protein CotJA [Bacillota bacterium]